MKLRVREVAQEKGLKTPQDLSHAARITHPTASKLWNATEGEDIDVLVSTLQKIAAALGVDWTDLIVDKQPA